MSKKITAMKFGIALLVLLFIYFIYLHLPYARVGFKVQTATIQDDGTITWTEDGILNIANSFGEAKALTLSGFEVKKCSGNEPNNIDLPIKKVQQDGKLITVIDTGALQDRTLAHYRIARLGLFDKTECFGLFTV